VPATLRVTHKLDFGIELRRGQFEVVLDTRAAGSVERHDTLDTPPDSGPYHPRAQGPLLEPGAVLRRRDGQAVNFPVPRMRDLAAVARVLRRATLAISLIANNRLAPRIFS